MVIVVGSGAGGATVAKELAAKDVTVTLIEKGPWIEEKDAFKHYSNIDSEVKVMRTFCLGGTTTVSAGNGVLSALLRMLTERKGAKIITGMPVDEVVVKSGEVKGVKSGDRMFSDDIVVLSAGALETPRLLKKLGLPTTSNFLFVDTFITIGGFLEGIGFNKEVTMNAAIKFKDFLLSPHFSSHLVDEKIVKGVTNRDAVLLSEGASIAGSILEEAGANPSTFVSTSLRGAHPGGTARIGVSLGNNLETGVSGLYVADASVLPAAPGAPPILTIVALAKYVSRIIAR